MGVPDIGLISNNDKKSTLGGGNSSKKHFELLGLKVIDFIHKFWAEQKIEQNCSRENNVSFADFLKYVKVHTEVVI